jgi:23S rRNA pseudouridine1911/1915/1917 synthase
MIGRGRNLSHERHRLTLAVKASHLVRLDRYLIGALAWRSRNRIQSLIRSGRIRVNGEVSKPSRRVRAGDVVELELSEGTGKPADYGDRRLEILYEDPWLIAVNKPPGLLVHPVGRHIYDTLINYLHHRYHLAAAAGEEVIPRLCHRIDRDTTGIVVVAKDAYVHREVMYQFENRLVSKEYVALVEGRFPADRGRIEIAIGEGRCLRSSLEHSVLKESATLVRVERAFAGHSLLACNPLTGRQNQIRVHLAAAGHPVAGDARYGRPAPPGFPRRYLLHSSAIDFYHPRLKSAVELRAELPEDFRELLAALEGAEGAPSEPPPLPRTAPAS